MEDHLVPLLCVIHHVITEEYAGDKLWDAIALVLEVILDLDASILLVVLNVHHLPFALLQILVILHHPLPLLQLRLPLHKQIQEQTQEQIQDQIQEQIKDLVQLMEELLHMAPTPLRLVVLMELILRMVQTHKLEELISNLKMEMEAKAMNLDLLQSKPLSLVSLFSS